MPIMRLDFLVNIMLSVGIKYSLLDLLIDVNNYALPKVAIRVTLLSALPLASARLSKL